MILVHVFGNRYVVTIKICDSSLLAATYRAFVLCARNSWASMDGRISVRVWAARS
ncbi:hypothetical protein CBM2598_U10162 [Cupriavidus taiwanensis]|nr:hypothetical protein CBM2597_U10189 [Cupriavidus taiwanensis]SOZ96352.1 hypothetical protein CBM2598_U10162 [Cupriavidus taiwanensis]